jgi:hypothetical protein
MHIFDTADSNIMKQSFFNMIFLNQNFGSTPEKILFLLKF